MLKLRPYKPCDAETIVSWCKDEAAFRRWTSDRYDKFPITAEDMNEKYIDNNAERTMVRLGFIIVDDTKRGKGYGKKMVQLATKYAVEFLGAQKVTLGVFENNPSAYHCYKAAGFRETGGTFNIPLFGETWQVIELEIERME